LKVTIVRGGGIAGVSTRTELASDALSPDDASALRHRVAESGLLETKTPADAGPSTPDEQQYELTVEHEGGTHTVRLRESDLPDPVRSLIAWTDSHPERREEIERAG
jgi:hypothetical protein